VRGQAIAVLSGRSSRVAAAIRGRATRAGLRPDQRKNADTCAKYLLNKRPSLDYPTALEAGWPISTGVIEAPAATSSTTGWTHRRPLGAPRRGGDPQAPGLHSNSDHEAYWAWHLAQEQRRTHQARYANVVIPAA